mgnify:FL=1
MPIKYSGDVRVYFEQYEAGTATISVGIKREVGELETTAVGDGAERFVRGIRMDKLDPPWSGYFNDGTSFDAYAKANIGSGTKVHSVFFGTTTGDIAYGQQLQLSTEALTFPNKGLVMANGSLRPDGTWDRGFVLLPRSTQTGSGISGSVDNGALSTGSGFWYLHAFSIGAGTTSTIALQDSADGITFADLGTQVISTGTAYRISIGSAASGTIRRYTQLRWDGTGTKSIASFIVRA